MHAGDFQRRLLLLLLGAHYQKCLLLEVLKKEKKKNAICVNITGKDQERMPFCVLHHLMGADTHNIPPGEYKISFSVGIRWLRGRSLHITRSTTNAQYCSDICGGCIQCLVGFCCGSDRMQASFFMSAVASNSEAVEWVPYVAAVTGACCSSQQAGWCEGFHGVRISEAIANFYVVLMPFLPFGKRCPHSTLF